MSPQHLFDVDKFSYQEEWELPPPAALALLAGPPWGATNGLNGSAHIAQTNGTSHSSDPSPSPAPVILDLRASSDFSATRLIGSRSTPLSSLRQSDPSPFEDSALLSTQWTELRARFVPPKPESHQAPAAGADVTACRESTGAGAGTCSGSTAALPALVAQLSQSRTPVLIICYEGDTSRVATSVLRHEGVQAYSVHGGLKAWAELGLPVEEVEG